MSGAGAPEIGDRPTRGFLFADLRGYTEFAAANGDHAAAALIDAYRAMVRGVAAAFAGTEIKTEGDSFYLLFSSVSRAVACGLAITDAARSEIAQHPDRPIHVGIGIHAGEAADAEGGPIGVAVNTAARICSQAEAGQVLVSETVRSLTASSRAFQFRSLGRRRLKGLPDPLALFAVSAVDGESHSDTRAPRRRSPLMRLRGPSRRAAAAIMAAVIVIASAAALAAPSLIGSPPLLNGGHLSLIADLALTGDGAAVTGPMSDAARLAVDDLNARGAAGGYVLELVLNDDANASYQAAQAMQHAAADPTAVAVMSPFGSEIARAEIPVTYAAGLLQCSPSATSPDLTKPAYGALDLRGGTDDRNNFVRLAPSDDSQGRAAALFAYQELSRRHALVVDVQDPFARSVADLEESTFRAQGGTTNRLTLNTTASPTAVADDLQADGSIDVVLFSGRARDAIAIRSGMSVAKRTSVAFISTDVLIDGDGTNPDSFIALGGASIDGTYSTQISNGPVDPAFAAGYRARFGREPSDYTAETYACIQVIGAAIARATQLRPADLAALRQLVRETAVAPGTAFDTVLGRTAFDSFGDSSRQFDRIERVDMTADGGAGAWELVEERDFGPGIPVPSSSPDR